jgi:16S rRNA (cytosine1402-N4)-methyltransferase
MLAEVRDALSLVPGAVAIDATLGDGGHAEAMLEATAPAGRVLGIDRDRDMLARAAERLTRFGDRLTTVHGNFANIAAIAAQEGFSSVQGILFDFGVASQHFDDP